MRSVDFPAFNLRQIAVALVYPILWVLAHKAAVAMNVAPGYYV